MDAHRQAGRHVADAIGIGLVFGARGDPAGQMQFPRFAGRKPGPQRAKRIDQHIVLLVMPADEKSADMQNDVLLGPGLEHLDGRV